MATTYGAILHVKRIRSVSNIRVKQSRTVPVALSRDEFESRSTNIVHAPADFFLGQPQYITSPHEKINYFVAMLSNPVALSNVS